MGKWVAFGSLDYHGDRRIYTRPGGWILGYGISDLVVILSVRAKLYSLIPQCPTLFFYHPLFASKTQPFTIQISSMHPKASNAASLKHNTDTNPGGPSLQEWKPQTTSKQEIENHTSTAANHQLSHSHPVDFTASVFWSTLVTAPRNTRSYPARKAKSAHAPAVP